MAYHMRPNDTSIKFAASVLREGACSDVEAKELTNHIDYLMDKALLERIEGRGWSFIRLTPQGIDFVEGAIAAPTGVAPMLFDDGGD